MRVRVRSTGSRVRVCREGVVRMYFVQSLYRL
jgi:hypothetical protein